MLARSGFLQHPQGIPTLLPLLVPSFSSKGFPFVKTRRKGRAARRISETSVALQALGAFMRESLLISAYDIHHKHFSAPQQALRQPTLLFLDSGGYELSEDFDSTEPVLRPYQRLRFRRGDYLDVIQDLTRLHARRPFVIANFDWGTRGQSVEAQILDAQDVFANAPAWLHNFIVKPGRRSGRFVDIDEVLRHADKLRAFSIVGVTEKELGDDIFARLQAIARLRATLDARGITSPIHIWGGLDPLITPLYFFAGAQIFDGVSWLRYAYVRGAAVNRECYGALERGLEVPRNKAIAECLYSNLTFLQKLQTALREFVAAGGERFTMFEDNAVPLERAYRTMRARISEMSGG
jgi:hypothetical protein